MRPILLLFSICFCLNLMAQGDKKPEFDRPKGCESITADAITKLVNSLSTNDLSSFDDELAYWIAQCGTTECNQRLVILRDMLENNNSERAIEDYFRKGYDSVFKDRVESSQEVDYVSLYTRDKSYFGYVPLNHPIDSIVLQRSLDLLANSMLTPDERLICIMFTGDFKSFSDKINQPEYSEGWISRYLNQDAREDYNRRGGINVYSGIYRPIGIRRIFTTSPMVGVSLRFPLKDKMEGELGVRFRFNSGDKDFDYYARGTVNTVNSDVSLILGVTLGYKLLESKSIILMPKLGIGMEVVNTGLYDEGEDSNYDNPFNVTTMNLSFGVTTLIPVLNNRCIGVGVNYHYCPYQWDKNLRTKFDTSAFSAELSWRF